jgi:hypothetical protein
MCSENKDSEEKVFVVIEYEVDESYYARENHDPQATVEFATPVRVFEKREMAEKYIKENERKGFSFEIFKMTLRR